MEVEKRLNSLRNLFNSNKIGGYIVPSTDEFMGEYTAPYAKRLEYITGFTGSNRLAIVLPEKVLFFTDGRYLMQASKQLGVGFEIYDLSELSRHLGDEILGYDAMLFTKNQLKMFGNANVQQVNLNLIDQIWENQPPFPSSLTYEYKAKYAGGESNIKLERLRQKMRDNGAQYCLLTLADSICWLLNIRASDIDFCPFKLGYCVVSLKDFSLFNKDEGNIDLSELPNFLRKIDGKCIVDNNSCPLGLAMHVQNPLFLDDPCQLMKACKNISEIEGSKSAHIKDAVALCEALAWVEQSFNTGAEISEYDIGLKLTELRSAQEDYVMDSFPPIVGYQDNGAIIHYRADKESAKLISGNGLLLIDSGGHYLGGTTDVTRTITIGAPLKEHIERYTDVLKGHITLVCQKFPEGTCGHTLDVLARMHLWQKELDYAHGTGHGVGNFLSVHEGPQRVSKGISATALQENMIISNEPGFYLEGEFGIRIENLIYVKRSGKFLGFENLTLVPYCSDLIDYSVLNDLEIAYIKAYNAKFMEKVYLKLSAGAKTWANKHVRTS